MVRRRTVDDSMTYWFPWKHLMARLRGIEFWSNATKNGLRLSVPNLDSPFALCHSPLSVPFHESAPEMSARPCGPRLSSVANAPAPNFSPVPCPPRGLGRATLNSDLAERHLSDELLEQVLEVLKPFDTATRVLSLHLVLPTKYTLSRHLTPCGTNNAVITQFKTHLLAQLEKYFHVTDIHAAASLLDPRIKNKQEVMSEEVRNRAMNTVQKNAAF